jgi:micrococcal nuclease
MGELRKPSEPLILSASGLTRQYVLDYIKDYRKWGEDRVALRREIFALQDEEQRLTAGDSYSAYSSPLSDLSQEILMHSMRKPREDFLSALADADVQKYKRAVRAVQLEQWLLESELMEDRRDSLANATKTTPARPSLGASLATDVASGPWRVERIVDGDTIEVIVGYTDQKEKVRLLNINTPEEGQTGYYEATAALRSLLEYRTIELEFEKPGAPTRDRYGRILAFVFVSDSLVNYEMVKRGWSDFYTDYGRGRYALPIEFAEGDARANRRGLHR